MIIIASDYDGTLNHHGVSEGDKEAIKKFREAGNKFGIVTGRDLEMATWVIYDLEKIGLEIDFVICCTGGIILSFDGEIKSAKKQKTGEYINEILSYARTLSLGVFRVSNEMTTCYADRKNRIKQDFSAISEMTQANAWFEKEEDAEKFLQYVKKNHANDISIFRNGGSIDMPPCGVSKVTGIYDYAKNYEGAKIYTVGDNVNDIPMLKEFESYTVSNARDEAKAAAKHECGRIENMIEEIMKENK